MKPLPLIYFILAGIDCISQPSVYAHKKHPDRRPEEKCTLAHSPNRSDDYTIGQWNDTLRVQFVMPSASGMAFRDSICIHDRIIIRNGNTTHEILPEHIRGFVYQGIYHEALRWPDTTKGPFATDSKIFCRRILDGAIPVYACNCFDTQPDGSKTIHSELIYKQGKQYKRASSLNFSRGVSRIFSDSSALAEKVRRGEFTREDFLSVVQRFNKYFEPKTSH